MKHNKTIGRMLSFALTLSMALGLAPSMAVPVMAADPDSEPQIIIKPNDYVSKPTDDAAKNDREMRKKLENRFRAYQIFAGQINETYDPTLNIHELIVTDWGASITENREARTKLLNDLEGNGTLAVNLGVTFDLLKATGDRYFDAVHLQAYKVIYETDHYWGSNKAGEGDMTAAGEAALNRAFNDASDKLTIGELFGAALKNNANNAAMTAAQVLADFTPNTGNPELARSFYAFVFAREKYKDGHEGDYKYLKEETEWTSEWDDTYGYWYIGKMEDVDVDGDEIPDRTLPDGYYMIWDAYGERNNEGKANASYMAAVYGYGTIELKSEAPHVTKTIENAGGNGASRELGSTISFKLTGTLPQNFFTAYLGYPYRFEDTMAPGLTYGGITRVYVQIPSAAGRFGLPGRMYDLYVVEEYKGGVAANQGAGYRYDEPVVGPTFTIKFPNLHELKGRRVTNEITWATDPEDEDPEKRPIIPINGNSLIIVEYTAVLNESANITDPNKGNQNNVVLHYANEPLWDPAAEHEGGTWNNNWNDAPTGKSSDTVFLYDFGVQLTVYDKKDAVETETPTADPDASEAPAGETEDRVPLEGAGFALKKSEYDYAVSEYKDYYAILHKTKTPGFNGNGSQGRAEYTYYLAGWVAEADLYDYLAGEPGEASKSWSDALEEGAEIGGFPVPAAVSLFENDPEGGESDAEGDYYSAVMTDENGVVRIVGLDNSAYYLEEVIIPEGSAPINDDISVSFSPSYYNGQLENLTATAVGAAYEEEDGTILSNGNFVNGYSEMVARLIINTESTIEVDTGGMGTALFYIGGGALLAGAALILIISNAKSRKPEKRDR